jgi:hypothetical protein
LYFSSFFFLQVLFIVFFFLRLLFPFFVFLIPILLHLLLFLLYFSLPASFPNPPPSAFPVLCFAQPYGQGLNSWNLCWHWNVVWMFFFTWSSVFHSTCDQCSVCWRKCTSARVMKRFCHIQTTAYVTDQTLSVFCAKHLFRNSCCFRRIEIKFIWRKEMLGFNGL